MQSHKKTNKCKEIKRFLKNNKDFKWVRVMKREFHTPVYSIFIKTKETRENAFDTLREMVEKLGVNNFELSIEEV